MKTAALALTLGTAAAAPSLSRAAHAPTYPSLDTPAKVAAEYPKVAGEYIVVFKPEHPEASIAAHLASIKAQPAVYTVHKEWRIEAADARDAASSFRGYHVSTAHDNPAAAMVALGGDDAVASVEQNAVVRASRLRGKPPAVTADCKMQSGATWGITRTTTLQNDANSFYAYSAAGKGVTAYVIDTGIQCNHVEFKGRCTWGVDTANFPSPGTDLNGHGTHVAGTIGGTEHGLAKDVQLVAVAVLSASGSGTTAGVIEGVQWAATDAKTKGKGKAVANMSLGGGYSAASNGAVNAAYASGLPVVVASGNDNADSCGFSPASASNAFTVDASDNTDTRSGFSNYGKCSNIVAPGSAITAAWISSGTTAINTISGTSMASPHVAGVAAKMLSEADYTAKQLFAALSANATPNMVTYDAKSARSAQPLLHLDCEMSKSAANHAAVVAAE